MVGSFGVGKSSSVDVCQYQLCASRESSKIDPGKFIFVPSLYPYKINCTATKDSTLKKVSSRKTFSCVIVDHTSSTKEKNLAKAAFDKATTHFQVNILTKLYSYILLFKI